MSTPDLLPVTGEENRVVSDIIAADCAVSDPVWQELWNVIARHRIESTRQLSADLEAAKRCLVLAEERMRCFERGGIGIVHGVYPKYGAHSGPPAPP